MIVGWFFQNGALKLQPDGKKVVVDDKKYIRAAKGFFARLTRFSLTDDLEGLKKFIRDCVNATPPAFAQRVLEVKEKYIRLNLVNRNPNDEERLTVVK